MAVIHYIMFPIWRVRLYYVKLVTHENWFENYIYYIYIRNFPADRELRRVASFVVPSARSTSISRWWFKGVQRLMGRVTKLNRIFRIILLLLKKKKKKIKRGKKETFWKIVLPSRRRDATPAAVAGTTGTRCDLWSQGSTVFAGYTHGCFTRDRWRRGIFVRYTGWRWFFLFSISV